MSYNLHSEIVKSLEFGDQAKLKIIAGVDKLAKAVKSTLGASGKCVIFEDALGNPVITKDGVTVAESVVLLDPVENMGATLVKEAARNTVMEAGDGTTTATVLAQALLREVHKEIKDSNTSIRDIKDGINKCLIKINKYLDKSAVKIEGDMLRSVSSISCNNDIELGEIIAEAYETVGKDGVVLMETSDSNETWIDVVDGVKIECPLTSTHFITNKEKHRCELDNPLVLIVQSEIPNVRKIQTVLEHVIKKGRSLLLVAPVDQQVKTALTMNKVKGNIKINIIDLPGFGPTKKDATDDLAILTGATVINEELGDDLDLIDPRYLGEADYATTDNKSTVLTLSDDNPEISERVDEVRAMIKTEKNGFIKKKLEERLAMLSCSVGIIKVGADSKVELKEKKDRVEDAIYATRAALKEGIIAGGGIALLNASQSIKAKKGGEQVLLNSIKYPFDTIIQNAGLGKLIVGSIKKQGDGIDVVTGSVVNMVEAGIIDPVLVTKSALKNAVSVVSTIISANCVISNVRE